MPALCAWAVACAGLLATVCAGCARSLPACGTAPLLERAPLDDRDLVHLVPLGNLNPPGHTLPTDHVYLTVPLVLRDGRPVPAVVPVRAPGALRVVLVQRRDFTSGPRSGASEYKLQLASCAEVTFTLDHLLALAPRFAERVGATERGCGPERPGAESRWCRLPTRIEVRAGEQLGYAGGDGQYALDLGARDVRVTAGGFARRERHDGAAGKDDAHAVCPADYLPTTTRAALLDRAGGFSPERARTIEPRCGLVGQDVPGTAQGAWFRRGTSTLPEAPHLALVHDNVDPSRAVISSGTSLDGLGGAHAFTPRAEGQVNREFSTVIADGTLRCYQHLEGAPGRALLLQLLDDDHLRAEARAGECGAGPWTFATDTVDFER